MASRCVVRKLAECLDDHVAVLARGGRHGLAALAQQVPGGRRRASPPRDGDPAGHRADPGLRVGHRPHPAPALPGTGVRLLDAVLRLGQVARHRVHLVHHATARRPVEVVERLLRRLRSHVVPPSGPSTLIITR